MAGSGGHGYWGDGGPAIAAPLWMNGIAADGPGNLFIASAGYATIRLVTPDGTINTVAGADTVNGGYNFAHGFSGDGGPATLGTFADASSVAVDRMGNVYVADTGNNAVRVLRPANSPQHPAGAGMGRH